MAHFGGPFPFTALFFSWPYNHDGDLRLVTLNVNVCEAAHYDTTYSTSLTTFL